MADASSASRQVFGASIQGARSDQQDCFRSVWLSGARAWLLVVADGMGGHAAGAVASKVAADTFVASFVAANESNVPVDQALRQALDDANARISRQQAASPTLTGMGTTLLAVYLRGRSLCWISVGDSPLWTWHGGSMTRLNADHSLRALALGGPRGNVLVSALNGSPVAEVDCQTRPNLLRHGDVLVLASDGILTLDEREIASIMSSSVAHGADAIARKLLDRVEAARKPQQDNCTIVVGITRPDASTSAGRVPLIPKALAAVAAAIACAILLFVLSR